MLELKISKEVKELLPPLEAKELEQLEKNILEVGIREPIAVCKGYIIDGHNRYSIAKKHNLDFETIEYDFDNKNDVMIWIIENQLGRRNLADFVRSALSLKKKDYISAQSKENSLNNLKRGTEKPDGLESAPRGRTSEILAKEADVSVDFIKKTEYILNNASQENIEALKNNDKDTSVNKVYTETRSNKDPIYKEKQETKKARKTFDEKLEEARAWNSDPKNQVNTSVSTISNTTLLKDVTNHIDRIENDGERQEFCLSLIKLAKEYIRKAHIK